MTISPSSQEPRWRRLPEERPRQIVDAALAVFGERGLASARLEDIAKRAGVSKGTIYLYFPNKEELFREVIRHTVIACLDDAERDFAASPNMRPSEAVRRYITGWWKFFRTADYQIVQRLVNSEIAHFPDLARFYADEVVMRSHNLSTQLVQRAIDAGEFRQVDARAAARMASAMLRSHAQWCHFRNHFPDLSPDDDTVLAQILD